MKYVGIALGLIGLLAVGCEKSGSKVSLPKAGETAKTEEPQAAQKEEQPQQAEAQQASGSNETPNEVGAAPAAEPAATTAPESSGSKFSGRGVHVISGQIFAKQSADIGFQVAGFIKSIDKDSGAQVKEGDVLAQLDDTDANLQMQVAEARAQQAKAAFANAKAEFEREKKLKAADAASLSSFDQRRSQYEQAKAASDLAELEVQRSRLNLDRTKLKATFNGIISARMKDVGEYVTSGAPVYTLVSQQDTEVRMQVPEQLLGQLSAGQKIKVSIPSLSKDYTATIVRVVPVISDRSRSFMIYAEIDGDKTQITPGLFAEAQITTDGSH